MCRLLPLWFPIFAAQRVNPTFICMNRNPFEVVGSLQKRDGFTREKALVLWLSHSLSAEFHSRGHRRIFTDFDRVVENPAEILLQIEQEANLVFPRQVNEVKEEIDGFVSPGLRHHKIDVAAEQSCEGLSSMAYELYRILNEMSRKTSREISQENRGSYELIDGIAADFVTYQKKWNPELLEQIRYLNQERADYRIKFFRIYKSWSWLLVKPIWLIEKALRKY